MRVAHCYELQNGLKPNLQARFWRDELIFKTRLFISAELPVSIQVKIMFLSVAQDCDELCFFWLQIRNLSKNAVSIAPFLARKYVFGGSCTPNHVFDRNPVFAVREQQAMFHQKWTPYSKRSWSKGYTLEWNSFFLKFKIHFVRHTLHFFELILS